MLEIVYRQGNWPTMNNPPSTQRKHRSPLATSIGLIAGIAGVLTAFFGTTFVHELFAGALRDFTSERYGDGWTGVVNFFAFWLIALALFAVGRAVIAGGFTTLALWLARRAF